jgi:hypothetical protein
VSIAERELGDEADKRVARLKEEDAGGSSIRDGDRRAVRTSERAGYFPGLFRCPSGSPQR